MIPCSLFFESVTNNTIRHLVKSQYMFFIIVFLGIIYIDLANRG